MQRPVFTFRDFADYAGIYDMSIPVYRDIWEIYRDGSAPMWGIDQIEEFEILDQITDEGLSFEDAVK